MTAKRLVKISFFTTMTIIGGFIRLDFGFVSFTLQTFFVILSGLFIGARDGFISQILYMLIGLVGMPIFTQGGGLSYIFKPSFGYILSFCLGAFISGKIVEKVLIDSIWKVWFSCLMGLVIIYVIGMIYQVIVLVNINMLSLKASLLSLMPILVYFVIDIIILLVFSTLYKKIKFLLNE